MNQLDSQSFAYNITTSVEMEGELRHHLLEDSFRLVISRHEALRTTFSTIDSQPVQIISPHIDFALHLVDLRLVAGPQLAAVVDGLTTQEAKRPFDLKAGPLIRGSLLRLAAQTHVLLLSMHHIVSDGWSIGVLIREVGEAYEAMWEGRQARLADLPVQYADYALWQREALKGEALDEQVRYWKRQLEGAPGVVEVASDRSRPAVASYRGATQEVEVGVEVREGLKEMSRGEGATLYMALMSAYRVLLWRYSGQGDVVIGTPIANRSRAEVEGLIGFFVNTLVMRSRVGGGMSYREVMRREKEVALGAYGHQEVPFEKLVEELRPERNLSHMPLFQVMFVLQNTSAEELKLRGMRLRAKAVSNGTTNFDLILNVKETEEGLRGVMEYSTDLFDASTIRRMLESFKALLEGVVANPDARLVDIPITSESREAAAGYGSSPQSVFEGDRFVF